MCIRDSKNTGPDTSEEPGQVESTLAACVIFSVKESVFKCLYPALHEWIGLRDAHVSLRFDPNTLPGSLNGALNPLTPDAKPASTLSGQIGSYTVTFKPEISVKAHQLVGSRRASANTDGDDNSAVHDLEFFGHFLITRERIISTAELFQQNL